MASGAIGKHRVLCERPQAGEKVASRPTIRSPNPLASFVLHMMCHNIVNPQRQRRLANHVTIGGRLVVGEIDDMVKVIEEWEGDCGKSNRT
jgi:hypothetical protein